VLLIANGIQKNNSNEYLNLVSPLKKKRLGIRIIFNKRIVEEYIGSIKVSHSEIGKGTTTCKSVKKAS
jgi:hypothetical protein